MLAEILEWPEIKNYSDALEWLVIAPVLFWILIMTLIRQAAPELLKMQIKPGLQNFVGWLVLFSAWMFLSKLRAFYGTGMVMYFLALIWLADISAYFVGKQWGKDALSPEISPGKTVQGMYGALGSAALAGVALRVYYGLAAFDQDGAELVVLMAVDLILLSILTVLISIYGDLLKTVANYYLAMVEF
jgi:phosphatidate cytidylyltransferase